MLTERKSELNGIGWFWFRGSLVQNINGGGSYKVRTLDLLSIEVIDNVYFLLNDMASKASLAHELVFDRLPSVSP